MLIGVELKKAGVLVEKACYISPVLKSFGSISVLTKAGSGTMGETNTNQPCPNTMNSLPCPFPSDQRLKRDIALLGTHESGIGLYAYRYDRSLKADLPNGWFFGVMAQEAQGVAPHAVVEQDEGYLAVDYQVLNASARRSTIVSHAG
jgi:hypothetical protein